jgi:hypothetical protein
VLDLLKVDHHHATRCADHRERSLENEPSAD